MQETNLFEAVHYRASGSMVPLGNCGAKYGHSTPDVSQVTCAKCKTLPVFKVAVALSEDRTPTDDDHAFGPQSSRPAGRPEIGGAVHIRLGELLAPVDAYAAISGVSRADAVRALISRGLGSLESE